MEFADDDDTDVSAAGSFTTFVSFDVEDEAANLADLVPVLAIATLQIPAALLLTLLNTAFKAKPEFKVKIRKDGPKALFGDEKHNIKFVCKQQVQAVVDQ